MGNPSEIERQYEGNDLPAIRTANAERRRIKEGATASPWVDDGGYRVRNSEFNVLFETKHFQASTGMDTAFCAAARNDPVEDVVDYLCDEVERLRTELEKVRAGR